MMFQAAAIFVIAVNLLLVFVSANVALKDFEEGNNRDGVIAVIGCAFFMLTIRVVLGGAF